MGVNIHYLHFHVGACVCAHVMSNFATPCIVAPLSMGFSRQEYWSGLPCPPPGVLPNPVIKPSSPASPELQVSSLPAEPLGKPLETCR